MTPALLEFATLCRGNGLRVSTSEVLDMMRAVELCGVEDPDTLKAALEATLVKRAVDRELFSEIFDLYFRRLGDFLPRQGSETPPLWEALKKAGLSDDQIESLLAILADEAARMQPMARAGLGLRRSKIEALIRLAGIQVDFSRLGNRLQIGFFTQRLLDQLGFSKAEESLAGLETRLADKIGADSAALIRKIAEENLAKIRAGVRNYVDDEFERRNRAFDEKLKEDLLANKPFSAMTQAELEKLRGEVGRLARKLKQMVSLRRKVERRGRLDARRTLRRALSTGGVPFRLHHKKRLVEKPRLVVLCDISDSVRHVSRFMLQLAYTLQELFEKVRSFVFVSELGECTALFRENEIDHAVDLAYAGGVVSVFANSNYGRSFRMFERRYLDSLTPRTSILVIGDARNNYNPSEAGALAEMRKRARRILWMNPEPVGSWSFGDSAMRDYEPFCDRTFVVNSLASLSRAVDSLVL